MTLQFSLLGNEGSPTSSPITRLFEEPCTIKNVVALLLDDNKQCYNQIMLFSRIQVKGLPYREHGGCAFPCQKFAYPPQPEKIPLQMSSPLPPPLKVNLPNVHSQFSCYNPINTFFLTVVVALVPLFCLFLFFKKTVKKLFLFSRYSNFFLSMLFARFK